jgi:hypothetical protein
MNNVKYIPYGETKIVIDKVTYQNNGDKKTILPVDKISKEELDRLVKDRFIVILELNDSGSDTDKPKEDPKKKANEKLLKKALEAGLAATEEMTDEEIQKLITEAAKKPEKPLAQMNKDELKAKAKELGIDTNLFDSEDKLRQKILEANG